MSVRRKVKLVMRKILIIEDDREINGLLCRFLSKNGFDPIASYDGLEGIEQFTKNENIRLILLDLMLPFKSGDMVLREIREKSDVPVIAVSAKGMVQTKIDIIKSGADDYVTKPFDLDELLVRIEAVLRRYGRGADEVGGQNRDTDDMEILTYKKLIMNREANEVTVSGNPVELTAKEYAILRLLMENPRKMFSKANLFESVWGEEYVTDEGAVKVHISNIRSKIKKYDDENEYIDTVWGMGYRLAKS